MFSAVEVEYDGLLSTIVLHQWVLSPFCGKIRQILQHKGLAYSTIEYNGFRARKAPGVSATGKLPALDYDGERILDSTEIAAFLEAKHPENPIYPADPVQRANAAIWEDWADESLYWFEVYLRVMYPEALDKGATLLCEGRPGYERGLFKTALKRMYVKKLMAQGLGKLAREQVEARFFGHLATLETLLTGRDWLVGDARSIADMSVSCQLHEILRTSHLVDRIQRHERVADWLSRNSERPRPVLRLLAG